MILDADASQIEWRVAAELSGDETMIHEIETGFDSHSHARDVLMGLKPTDENRTIAKIFNFRMIYGGSPYSFFMDPKMPMFTLPKWNKVVESFYDKYAGLKAQQDRWMEQVINTGEIVLPSGRRLRPFKQEKNGVFDYHRPQVVNYPVQAYATADIMALALSLIDELIIKIGGYQAGNEFIGQVHDSAVFDTINTKWAIWIGHVCVYVFRMLPRIIEQIGWQKHFRTPLDGEMDIGESWGTVKTHEPDMELLDRLMQKFPISSFQI